MGDPTDIPASTPDDDTSQSLNLRTIAIKMVLGTLAIVVVVGGVLFIFKDELVAASGWFVDTLGGPGVALGFFLPDAFTVPLPNDAFTFLGYMSGQLSFWECVAWGSLGSLTGGAVAFVIGRSFQRTAWFQRVMAKRGREISELVRRYGKTALLLASLTPIPYSVACMAVGAGGMRFRWFFLISLTRILKVAFYLWLLVEGVLSSFDGYATAANVPDADPCQTSRFCEPGAACDFTDACDAVDRCEFGVEGRYYGRVGSADGTCVASDARACAKSSVTCQVWGQCSVVPEGRVYFRPDDCRRASKDQDFQASRNPACAGGGTCIALHYERCDADGKDCKVTRDDCEDSQVCAIEGRCTARDGICVVTSDADCARARACKTNGRCHLGQSGYCEARDDADCARSLACTDLGECGARSGHCVACKRSGGCRAEGRCAFEDDRCVRCGDAEACRREGHCAFAGGRCRATTPKHCEVSTVCRTEGRCRPSTRGNCVREAR